MATEMKSSEKLVLKLGSCTEKNLRHIQRIGTFGEKSHRSHIESAYFFLSLNVSGLWEESIKNRNV